MATTKATMSEESTITDPIEPFAVQSMTQSIIRPTLIIIMVAALMGAIFSVAIIAYPNQAWAFAFLICFLAIIESYFTTIWLNQPQRRNVHQLKYRSAEILVFALTVRILTWGVQGNWPQIDDSLQYLQNPASLFSGGYFWATLIFSLIAWQLTTAITHSFLRMEPDEAEQAYYSLPRHKRDPSTQPMSDNRSYLFHTFAQQFLGGGLVVLFCAALASFNLTDLTAAENPIISGITRLRLSPALLASLLLYFLCGFLLLSQGRLAILEMRWLTSGANLKTPVGRHWYRQTLFLLLAIGLIAAFLPIGSTLPFMRIINLILYGAISIISVLIYIITYLISLILAFLMPIDNTSVASPPPPPPPPPAAAPVETSETLQFILSSAFWTIAIIISMIAFSFFLKDRGVKINNTFLQRLWLTIKFWWYQIRQGINDQMQDIQGSLQSLFQQDDNTDPEQQPPWRFIRINSLSPREKVHYFYLSTIKRADQSGVPRHESETPTEFADELKTNWPDAEQEIEDLTEAFLQARYSPAPIAEEDITPIKKQWKRLKSNIRKQKKKTTND